MRVGSITILVLSIFLLIGSGFRTESQASDPNIIFIIADDVGWNDLGCYGNEVVHTPNIDALAAKGLRFDNAFLTASSCSPSRCSMITGRYPHNTGAAELHSPLPIEQIPFPLQLKEHGYHTVQAGKSHFGPNALRAFDKAHEMEGANHSGAGRWVQCLKERPRDKPFFAWFAAIDAHRAWQHDSLGYTHDPASIPVPPFLADDAETRKDLASYYHEISRWDYYIGEVVKELKAQEIYQNTAIFILSDNGMPFPRAKTRVYDSGMKTPLIVHWPARIDQGAVTRALVSSIDIGPTILDIAGVPTLPSFQGKSFLSIIQHPNLDFRQYVFSEHNWHDYEAHERMVRSTQFLYIKNNRTHLSNGGPADSKRSASQTSLDSLYAQGKLNAAQVDIFVTPRSSEELFDVNNDPWQLHNLAGDPKWSVTLEKYRNLLLEWMQSTHDNVPDSITADAFDRNTGNLLPDIEAFNKIVRGEMPGERNAAQKVNTKPGFKN